jgi:hypothetical protein
MFQLPDNKYFNHMDCLMANIAVALRVFVFIGGALVGHFNFKDSGQCSLQGSTRQDLQLLGHRKQPSQQIPSTAKSGRGEFPDPCSRLSFTTLLHAHSSPLITVHYKSTF